VLEGETFAILPLITVTADSCKNLLCLLLGLGTEFRSEKFRGIDSERFPLFHGRKCSFRGVPSSAEEPIVKLGTERNGMEFHEKIKFYGTCTIAQCKCTASLITLTAAEWFGRNSESLLLPLLHGTEFRVVFCR
jgi:hypothetical protein